jgi:hypothetical protein
MMILPACCTKTKHLICHSMLWLCGPGQSTVAVLATYVLKRLCCASTATHNPGQHIIELRMMMYRCGSCCCCSCVCSVIGGGHHSCCSCCHWGRHIRCRHCRRGCSWPGGWEQCRSRCTQTGTYTRAASECTQQKGTSGCRMPYKCNCHAAGCHPVC